VIQARFQTVARRLLIQTIRDNSGMLGSVDLVTTEPKCSEPVQMSIRFCVKGAGSRSSSIAQQVCSPAASPMIDSIARIRRCIFHLVRVPAAAATITVFDQPTI